MNTNSLYLSIANEIENQIKNKLYKIGDKLPSLRTLSEERGVSIATIQQAYLELENRNFIASKPQSGYFVVYNFKNNFSPPSVSKPLLLSKEHSSPEMMNTVVKNFYQAELLLSMSSAHLDPELVPIAKLNKSLVEATRRLKDSGVNYNKNGSLSLKTEIAKRSQHWGGKLTADDIIPTGGSIDSISFCLLSLTKRGDTIVVESPVYFGILRLAHSLGLNIVELPTHPVTGIEVSALKSLLAKNKISACILISNFSNPTGSCMPDENKKAVVTLLEKYNIPLIEDDVYGDLYFGAERPTTCKTYDESGVVLWCGSFSKSLASGYRVGWVAPGKFKQLIANTKLYHSMFSNNITHEAIGIFLEIGRYEKHLRKIRNILYQNALQFRRCVHLYFPEDTKLTNPKGGLNIWVEMHKNIDAGELYNKALGHNISITPGRLYTHQNQFNNCLKLSYGNVWNPSIEKALKTLGTLAKKMR